mmetsp:Transcript_14172/g.34509  ORF Transcript_14172/g.34509 Transcript_14172/m.34509 type:complete len:210 (+) Transcript_14172:124-753(+)
MGQPVARRRVGKRCSRQRRVSSTIRNPRFLARERERERERDGERLRDGERDRDQPKGIATPPGTWARSPEGNHHRQHQDPKPPYWPSNSVVRMRLSTFPAFVMRMRRSLSMYLISQDPFGSFLPSLELGPNSLVEMGIPNSLKTICSNKTSILVPLLRSARAVSCPLKGPNLRLLVTTPVFSSLEVTNCCHTSPTKGPTLPFEAPVVFV